MDQIYTSCANMDQTFIEVCAGCGGLSTGLIQAGFKPLMLNEMDKNCCMTLRANHPDVKVIQGNMCDIDVLEYKNKCDLLVGGIPCQSYSMAGKRKGLQDEKRGGLMLEFKRLIDDINPKVFMIENVKGLLFHDNGNTLNIILQHLNPDGRYNIRYKVINAGYYEVPQKRERIFIVAIRADIQKIFKFPKPIEDKIYLRDILVDVPESECAKYTGRKLEIMKMIPEGGCWINLPLDIQKEYLGGAFNSGGGKRGMARRLSMNEQCLTLTTSPAQKQTERCHPIETRPLSIREYARIQTFDDEFILCGSMLQKYKQIGNAVPVKLAYHIGRRLKKVLK